MVYVPPLYHWPPKSKWQERRRRPRAWGAYDAYVHFPFCRSICDFCGYETRLVTRASSQRLSQQLVDEILDYRRFDDFTEARGRSVFFGGGTGSLLTETTVSALLEALGVEPECEITLECEPGTISRRKLARLRQSGVNRISVCAQSFDNAELRNISRKHTAADVLRLVEDCLAAGFTEIHIDLMYGLPGQTTGSWERSLRTALDLPFTHLSAYKLFVFKHGVLHREGHDRPGHENSACLKIVSEMYDLCHDICADFGLAQYTLTEFAKNGHQSVYLTNSFSGGDLLPIGPSAFGRNHFELWENSPYVSTYGNFELREKFSREFLLTAASAFKRHVILGLWLLKVDVLATAHLYGVRAGAGLLAFLQDVHFRGDAEYQDGALFIPTRSRFFVGQLMAELAALPLCHWTVRDDPRDTCHEQMLEAEQSPEELEVASILRVARRDSAFYQRLRISPEATLKQLGLDLGIAAQRDLADAIAGAGERDGTNTRARRYREIWLQIEREHVSAR